VVRVVQAGGRLLRVDVRVAEVCALRLWRFWSRRWVRCLSMGGVELELGGARGRTNVVRGAGRFGVVSQGWSGRGGVVWRVGREAVESVQCITGEGLWRVGGGA